MRVPAPYFLSLAAHVLERLGRDGPGGRAYEDRLCRITGEGDDLTVDLKPEAPGGAGGGGLAASRVSGVVTSTWLHTKLSAHLERLVAEGHPGENVYAFVVAGPDGAPVPRHVEGRDLRDAVTWLAGSAEDLEILGLRDVVPRSGFDAPAMATNAVAADRAWRERLAAAAACPDDVYVIAWRHPPDGGPADVRHAPAIRASGLADAEAGLRGMEGIPAGARIVRVDVLTMTEYLAARGGEAPEPHPAPMAS